VNCLEIFVWRFWEVRSKFETRRGRIQSLENLLRSRDAQTWFFAFVATQVCKKNYNLAWRALGHVCQEWTEKQQLIAFAYDLFYCLCSLSHFI
jgi:hypothetical protein